MSTTTSEVRVSSTRARRCAVAALVGLSLAAGAARATEVGYERRYGVGLVVGDPTGLSGKAWVGPTNAIDVGVGDAGYGYGYRGGCFRDVDGRPVCDRVWGQRSLSVHADFLWQSKIVRASAVQLDWHVGGGARALFVGDPCGFDCWDLGVRAPVGLDLAFTRPDFLEVFLELAPAIYFVPAAFFGFDGGLGARAYF
jgi:hypothetical protein